MSVGPVLAERADRDVHEIGPRLAKRREAELARVHRAGARVLDHEVGARDEREEVRAAARAVEIQRDAAFAAVERVQAQARERGRHTGHERFGAARVAAVRRLHLDHVGAEPGQHHRAERGASVGEVEHAVGREGCGRSGHRAAIISP